MARRAGTRRDGSGRAEEAARTTRRWFEFVSTRYRSSGSICPRPSFCVAPSPSTTRSLHRARYLDSPASFSVALYRSRFFFVPRFVPDTRRADPLHYPLSLSLSSLPRASSSRDSRIGSRSTSLWLFPSFYLSRSIYPPSSGAREHRVSIRLRSALRICFLAPVLSFSLLPPALRRARFSRSFFRCSTASRSSLRSIAMRETGRARGGEARAEEEKEDEEEEEGEGEGGGGGGGGGEFTFHREALGGIGISEDRG